MMVKNLNLIWKRKDFVLLNNQGHAKVNIKQDMILIIHRNFVPGQITHKVRVISITFYPEQTHNLRIFVILIEIKSNSRSASVKYNNWHPLVFWNFMKIS